MDILEKTMRCILNDKIKLMKKNSEEIQKIKNEHKIEIESFNSIISNIKNEKDVVEDHLLKITAEHKHLIKKLKLKHEDCCNLVKEMKEIQIQENIWIKQNNTLRDLLEENGISITSTNEVMMITQEYEMQSSRKFIKTKLFDDQAKELLYFGSSLKETQTKADENLNRSNDDMKNYLVERGVQTDETSIPTYFRKKNDNNLSHKSTINVLKLKNGIETENIESDGSLSASLSSRLKKKESAVDVIKIAKNMNSKQINNLFFKGNK